jgi:hypothetical protein
MIWRGWRRGCEFVMRKGRRRQMGPQVNCFWVVSNYFEEVERVKRVGKWRGEARERETNSSDSLHAENEGVRSEISRI